VHISAQTLGLDAHFCTNDVQTIGVVRTSKFKGAGAIVSIAPPPILFFG